MNIRPLKYSELRNKHTNPQIVRCCICGQKLFEMDDVKVGTFRVRCRRCKNFVEVVVSENDKDSAVEQR